MKAGFTPQTIRCNCTGEYICQHTLKFFEDNKIRQQFLNPREQFGNGMSEKFVDTLGKGIRTLLLQSNWPPEFWGQAAHYYVDIYNHTPHSSIKNQIPYNVHHGRRCDVSWFRPFGCQATLFRGKDIVEHHKLAQCGEQGVMLGLGMSHCRKCWLIFCPQLNRVFASRNVTFDETLFPLKDTDQLVYGFYDNQAITRLQADTYEQPSCATCDFESIDDDQFPMCNTIDVDAYADRNNATDHVAQDVYGTDDNDVTDIRTDNDGLERVKDCGGKRRSARNI
eukprot:2684864-Rhodomonas_salina.1